jgi:hypothetical protein
LMQLMGLAAIYQRARTSRPGPRASDLSLSVARAIAPGTRLPRPRARSLRRLAAHLFGAWGKPLVTIGSGRHK